MANRLLSRSNNFQSLLPRWSSDVKFQPMSIHRRSIIPSGFFTANSSPHSSDKSNWSCPRGRRILGFHKKFDGSSEDSFVNLQAKKMVSKWNSWNSMGKKWIPFVLTEARVGNIQRSFSVYFSSVASDMSLEGSHRDEPVNVSGNDENLLGDRTLKLLSGSCYLPHPDKEETGGEDAHFICADEQAIGVADGVGGWADLGVNAGQYARELMANCIAAIKEAPKGAIDPASVLEKAYLSTKSRGSSTACIIVLADGGVRAVNLGDSGFIVVRDGSTIFRSPAQQHDFNFTYQLESGNGSDLPSAAEVFKFPVAPGDVIVAGTDGLFDNLYNNEISGTVVHAIRIGLEPHATAQKIAALARQRAQDKDRQTPFSTAAQEAGFRYYGGKLDDITVVVSYVTASSS